MATRRLVIQISDLHLVPTGELRPGVDPCANLKALLARLEALPHHPDALLLTGDLADGGDAASYELLRALVEPVAQRLGATLCYLPGNHDDRSEMRVHLLGEHRSEAPIDAVAFCGGLRLVMLDSPVPGSDPGELRDAQLEWLAALLRHPADEGTLLALHHPPVGSPIEQMDAIALRHPERLGEVIAGTDVLAVLAGHDHHSSSGTLAGIAVSIAAASSYRADALEETRFTGVPGGGFSRIDVAGHAALVTYLPI